MAATNRIYNMKRFSKLLLSQVPAAAELVFAYDFSPFEAGKAGHFDAACTALGYVLQAVRESGNHNRASELWYKYNAEWVPVGKIKPGPNDRPLDESLVRRIENDMRQYGIHRIVGVDRRYRITDGHHQFEAIRRLGPGRAPTVRVIVGGKRRKPGDTMPLLWRAACEAGHRYASGKHAAEYRRVGADLLSARADAWGLDVGAPANAVGDRILGKLAESR